MADTKGIVGDLVRLMRDRRDTLQGHADTLDELLRRVEEPDPDWELINAVYRPGEPSPSREQVLERAATFFQRERDDERRYLSHLLGERNDAKSQTVIREYVALLASKERDARKEVAVLDEDITARERDVVALTWLRERLQGDDAPVIDQAADLIETGMSIGEAARQLFAERDGKHIPAGKGGYDRSPNPIDLVEFTRPRLSYPALVPELRAHLLSLWQPGRAFHAVAPHMGGGPIHDPDKLVGWEQRTLERATLWWVSHDMLPVLLAAAASVPDDVLGQDVEPLSPYGFVVLENAWQGTSSTPGQSVVEVNAFAWGPTALPPIDGRTEVTGAVSVSSYTGFPAVAAQLDPKAGHVLHGLMWAPLGRSDWPLADPIGQAPWQMEEQTLRSFVEDRRVLCALMTLLAHDGIASQVKAVAPRGTRRRLDREAGKARDHSYRIVTLRRLREPGDPTTGDAPKRDHDHRWIVSGHWRRQPYGPGRSLRRLQWINPFVCGPEDKPLREKEVIHAWRRL